MHFLLFFFLNITYYYAVYVIIQILSEHFIHTQEKTDLENDKNKQANKKLYKHLDGLQNVYSGMNQEGQFKEKT